MRGLALSEDRSFLLRPREPPPILVPPRMLGDDLEPTAQLRQLGEGLWLDRIARKMLTSRQLQRIDIDALAATRQTNRADRFVESGDDVMSRIDDQVAVVGS